MNRFSILTFSTAGVITNAEKKESIANTAPVADRWLLAIVAAFAGFILLAEPAFAGLPTQTWSGGSNTWYQGASGSDGYDWNTNAVWNGGNDIAYFTTTPGTVTVNDSVSPVTFDYMYFNSTSTSNWDVTGDALMKYTYTDTSSASTIVQLGSSEKGNVTIDSPLLVDDTGYGPGYFNIDNSSANGSLTINGSITFYSSKTTTLNSSTGTEDGSGGRIIYFDGDFENAAATTNVININSTFSMGSTGYTPLYLVFGNDTHTGSSPGDSIYNLESSFSLSGIASSSLAINGGTVYDKGANFGVAGIGFGHTANTAASLGTYRAFLTVGAQNITNGILDSAKGNAGLGWATIGGSDAYLSTFSGGMDLDSTGVTLTSASGGRDVFSGQIYGRSPDGIIKSGAGTVVLSYASGNSYTVASDFQSTVPAGTVAADLQGGTTLITNTAGSAFGNTTTATVNVEAGAALGGTGTSRQEVIAEAATSVITAGDPGQSSLKINPTIGTLTLAGGLVAANGLTLDFKLNGDGNDAGYPPNEPGVNNDLLIVNSLTLDGTVTVNLTAMDTLQTGTGNQYYLLIDNDGTPVGDPTFNVIAPTGYALDTSYGLSDGLPDDLNTGYKYQNGVFSVQLVATPEPSTYGLLGLGLLALVGIGRSMHRGSSKTLQAGDAGTRK